MKLLYSSLTLIVLISFTVGNPNIAPAGNFHPRRTSTYCSPECEFKYFSAFNFQRRMFAEFILPLPTTIDNLESTCRLTDAFLNCSETATVGCREGRPPMVRLAQIKEAYEYLCTDGRNDFLQVLPCLGKHYDQNQTEICVQQLKKQDNVRRGPDGDLCKELEYYEKCATENAFKSCGQSGFDFLSTFMKKVHKELKRIVSCHQFKI